MAEVPQCWSCGKEISGDITECPHCGMPLKKESSKGDLDFLDDLLAATSSSETAVKEKDEDALDFVIPDMDYVSGTTDATSSPKGEFDEGYGEEDELDFVIPDMDYVSGKTDTTSSPKGEFDTISSHTQVQNSPETTSTISQSDKESLLADMDSLFDKPSESDTKVEEFDLDFSDDIDQLLEKPAEEVIEVTEEVSTKVATRKLIWLFTSQIFYWTTIYLLIVFASYEVVDPNFDPATITATDFNISPFGFLIAWASFFAMGWFYSFKLQEYNITPKLRYGLIFLVLYTISIYATDFVMTYLYIGSLNPETNPINYLLTSYFLILPQHYLSTLLSAGWFFFLLGYKYLWEHVYKLTPAYDIAHGSIEL